MHETLAMYDKCVNRATAGVRMGVCPQRACALLGHLCLGEIPRPQLISTTRVLRWAEDLVTRWERSLSPQTSRGGQAGCRTSAGPISFPAKTSSGVSGDAWRAWRQCPPWPVTTLCVSHISTWQSSATATATS